MDFRLYRSGPLDAALRLSGDRWLGVMVKRPAFGGSYFRDRIQFARTTALGLSGLFIVVPTRADTLDSLNAARRLGRIGCVVSQAEQAGDATADVWSVPRHSDTCLSLSEVLEAFSAPARSPRRRIYSEEYEPSDDIAGPRPLSLQDKRLIHTIADWPLADLARLSRLAGRGRRGTRKTLERLRGLGLVHTVRLGGVGWYALGDHGIDLVSAASRTRAHVNRRSWSPKRTESGLLRGTKLRKLAREIDHTQMAHQFIGDLRTQAMNHGGWQGAN